MANKYPQLHDEFDRERGILTPRDRRFLAGLLDDELNDNEARVKRYRLRQRMVHALIDLQYLSVMSTEDIGQIAEKFGFPDGWTPRDGAPPDGVDTEELDRQVWRRGGLEVGVGQLLAFTRELLSDSQFEYMLQHHLREQAILNHYEETGRYGEYEVSFELELVGEMSIDELEELVYGDYDPPFIAPDTPPAATEVLDLHGVERAKYEPRHPDLLEPIKELIRELSDGNGEANAPDVIETLAEREGISQERAAVVYEDLLFAGQAYEPAPEPAPYSEELNRTIKLV